MTRRVIRHPNAAILAAGVATRLAVSIMDSLAEQESAHVLISGGPLTLAGLAALAEQPLLHAVDFSRVHVWWTDEGLLPAGHPDRNETRARQVLQGVIAFPPTHVHSMPPGGPDVEAAAAAADYAGQLRRFGGSGEVPEFDVVLLDLGRAGEVAGLAPDRPEVQAHESTVIVVPDPATWEPARLSVTLPVLCSGRQVWLLASGRGVADATHVAWQTPPDATGCPASVVRGRDATLLMLDAAAASGLAR